MSEEKTYTLEEAKEHGRVFIKQQAEILRKNLRKSKESNKDFYHV